MRNYSLPVTVATIVAMCSGCQGYPKSPVASTEVSTCNEQVADPITGIELNYIRTLCAKMDSCLCNPSDSTLCKDIYGEDFYIYPINGTARECYEELTAALNNSYLLSQDKAECVAYWFAMPEFRGCVLDDFDGWCTKDFLAGMPDSYVDEFFKHLEESYNNWFTATEE